LTAPAVAWAGFHFVMIGWHWPPIYEATLRHEGLHRFGHLLLLATATLFWLPALAPPAGWPGRPGLAPWAALLYLGAAMVAGTLLGIVLAFAPPLYLTYLAPTDSLGILLALREEWGLTPAADQQLGGLLMWIPGGLAYSFVALLALARWLNEPDSSSRQHSALSTQPAGGIRTPPTGGDRQDLRAARGRTDG
jgi:cytochrome c oxidase assembly factor CtaG